MKKLLVSVITIIVVSHALGQSGQSMPGKDTLTYNLSSPYHTVLTHLKYLQPENYHPKVAAKVFDPDRFSPSTAKQLAIELKQIYDGRGIYIDLEEIPNVKNYKDSVSNKNRFYLLPNKYPNLYLEKKGKRWYYSSKSASKIDQWHKNVYILGTDKLLELLPTGGKKYLGLYTWQLVGILILITASFVLHKLFTFLIEKLFIQLLLRFGHRKLADEVVIPVAKPVSFLVIFPLLILFVPVLQLPIKMAEYVILALKAIWPVFAIVFFYRLVDIVSMYFGRMAEQTESTLDDQLVPLVRKVLKTFVVIVGGLFILDNLEFDITGLIAGISIGGLAFALAAQDTIKNFFGSLMIFVDRPFQVGDWISSGDVDGTVEEVGFRSTRIRTFRDSLMYIPNGVITNQMIDNHGLRTYRRFMTTIAVTYDTPPERIEVFVEGLKEIVKNHKKTRKDYYEIHLNNMADSSLSILFYIFFEVPSWSEELRSRHEVLLSIIMLAEELGVHFAFPTQTLHVETFPEKKGNSPEYTESTPELKKKVQAFLEKNKKTDN
ncbi:MAG: mechanosensitive ion channel family protein [Fulvivirga sp.]|nr:mechanosensitive ion channel family protein [Fulvivirga sp.]